MKRKSKEKQIAEAGRRKEIVMPEAKNCADENGIGKSEGRRCLRILHFQNKPEGGTKDQSKP